MKKILLREANAEGHRCIKRKQLPFANLAIQLSFTHTLSTKKKKHCQYGRWSLVYCNRNNKHGELMGIHAMHLPSMSQHQNDLTKLTIIILVMKNGYRPVSQLTAWRRSILLKIQVAHLMTKFHVFQGIRTFITAFTTARHLSTSSLPDKDPF